MRTSRLAYLFGLSAALTVCVGLWSTPSHAQTATQQIGSRLDAALYASQIQTATTTTLTPGAGNYVYLTGIDVQACAGSTAVTAAAPTYITVTGFTGNPQWQVGSGGASITGRPGTGAGGCTTTVTAFTGMLKSATPGTAVVFTTPTLATNQTTNVNLFYFYAP